MSSRKYIQLASGTYPRYAVELDDTGTITGATGIIPDWQSTQLNLSTWPCADTGLAATLQANIGSYIDGYPDNNFRTS